jgi:signal transduction histidine kinase
MGVGFLIALAAGSMADASRREHAKVIKLLEAERETAEALRSLDKLKSEFLSAVSHELRTPLTSILGFAITLQHQADELDGVNRSMLDLVVAEAQHLQRLLGDLLDVDVLLRGQGRLNLTLVDVAVLVRSACDQIAARERRVVDVEADSIVTKLDGPKIERVIENLVVNAVKYSPSSEPVVVRATAEQDGMLIAVEDRGPGVPKPLRESIFEPFQRGEAATPHAPGTGIGLSLVDRFSRLHGGAAWVESRDGGGSSFRVFIPYSDEVLRD